ncbi:hypothetical protein KAFR_0A06960 [Kazachstania africana CBS 2517]|uniref:UBX domain-containing protein n=1 Tax=Kazachstania africana (strain ATCC 22294 / BCRC 22015 / CBS 2517 / CECT 1963 / NBRC 1671 / NRRL Y-8276) TaxID=1071382 RepID=H2AP31_KAZAF|nr:hypothetical protein KAFR_0A06960 [Kazachstania africana CBS 2517]CCF56131.1 hypothetical protein KAFR_0A06960 [Kazachstania africana CBS 2517]
MNGISHFLGARHADPVSSSMPGSFPRENNDANARSHSHNFKGFLKYLSFALLRIPLFFSYCLLSIIVSTFTYLNKLSDFGLLYNRKTTDHAVELNILIETLSNESLSYNSTTYNFGSIYNPQSQGIVSKSIVESYTSLLNSCTQNFKFGLIYIHDPVNDHSLKFVNEILCNEEFVHLIKKYQMLYWFGSILTSEGLQVSNALKFRKLPAIGLLCLTNSNKIELVYKIEGTLRSSNFAKLDRVLSKYYPQLMILRQQKKNTDMHRLLREDQDARFNESLRIDRERERQRIEQLERENELANREILKKQWLLWRKTQLHTPTQGSSCQIAIRFNGTERTIEKFDPNAPIEEIYVFADLYRNKLLDSDEVYDEPPLNYQHKYDFLLAAPSPRTILEPTILIKDEATIYPSGNVVVEDVVD